MFHWAATYTRLLLDSGDSLHPSVPRENPSAAQHGVEIYLEGTRH